MSSGFLCCLLGCASLLSCTTYMPSVAPDQRPTGKEAIVYGRFQVEGSFTPDVAHSSMALVMRCQDSREYRIRFDDAEPIIVLATAPSTCWLDEMLYLDADNNPLGRTTLPDHVRRATRLDAGRAYYLGDFSSSIRYEFAGGLHENFQVKDWRNNFTTTTQDFKERFPNLRNIVTVDPLPRRENY